ncbi:MAG: hypothetical protein KAJ10_08055 [Thermodesulfovibrionia bacterium]|nr:hypothetical protein [Thermodesulfovibrionia bacterium]
MSFAFGTNALWCGGAMGAMIDVPKKVKKIEEKKMKKNSRFTYLPRETSSG